MDFTSSILGHTRQQAQLQRELQQGKLAHAYLFAGRKHLGKFTLARWFAGEILTQGLREEEKEQNLQQIQRNIHPDLLILDQLWIDGQCTDWTIIARSSNVPQQHRVKARAKTNTISIDDIRVLQEYLHETPQKATRLCCLIRSIERLHITAANALLKILEEPPPHALFCFTTESLSSLPPTIVSRLRVLPFFPLQPRELEPLIAKLAEEDRPLLLRLAEGCPGVIIQCLRDTETLRQYRQTQVDVEHFLETASPLERVLTLRKVLEHDEERFFLQLLLHSLRHSLHGGNPEHVNRALSILRILTDLLQALQSNVPKPLLALHASLNLPS